MFPIKDNKLKSLNISDINGIFFRGILLLDILHPSVIYSLKFKSPNFQRPPITTAIYIFYHGLPFLPTTVSWTKFSEEDNKFRSVSFQR